MENYVAVDLEMTGLNVKKDRILEIGAVRVEQGKITQSMSVMVNPHRRLEPEIVALTGITQEEADAGIEDIDALKQWMDLLQMDGIQLPILAHNIMYDFSFLKQCAVNHKISLEVKGIDTLKLARKLLPKLESKSLEYLCDYFQIERKQKHRALEDAMATSQIYELLKQNCEEKETGLFRPYELHYQIKKQSPIMPKQIRQIEQLCSAHQLKLDIDLESMTKGEASRLVDQILAKHGRSVEKEDKIRLSRG